MQDQSSEVQRFLREHAHRRQDLQPLLQHFPWLGEACGGEDGSFECALQPRSSQESPRSPSGFSPRAPLGRPIRPRPACRSVAAVAADTDVRMMVLRHFKSASAAFKALDLDGDGLLSKFEFRRAVEIACPQTSEEVMQRLWRWADSDKVGFITAGRLAEFLMPASC